MSEKNDEESLTRRMLTKLAKGYKVMEKKETIEEDGAGKRKRKTERHTKTLPPDLDALKLLMSRGGGEEGALTVVSGVPRPGDPQDASCG